MAKQQKKVPIPVKLVVGAAAGMFGTVCIFPIDMVKTHLQNQTITADGTREFRGPVDCARKLFKRSGFRGFYQGLGPNLVGVAPEKAIKLAVNEIMTEALTDEDGGITLGKQVLAGATAGFCQVSATNPMEIVKIRMQTMATLPAAERMSTVQVVRHLGLRGMYRGAAATWIRDVPFSIVFFPAYANIREAMARPDGSVGMGANLVAGCIAGALGAGICTPPDVVKTRLQVKGGSARYNGVVHCFTTIVQEEGAGALFKGLVPRCSVVAPLFGISLVAFELLRSWY